MKTKTQKFKRSYNDNNNFEERGETQCIYGIVKSNSIVAHVRTPRKMLEIDVERERE